MMFCRQFASNGRRAADRLMVRGELRLGRHFARHRHVEMVFLASEIKCARRTDPRRPAPGGSRKTAARYFMLLLTSAGASL